MHTGTTLTAALGAILPISYVGTLTRRVALAALLTPIQEGGKLSDLMFLFASRRRNRFNVEDGPNTIYFGESENVSSAETKRIPLLGDFAKTPSAPACDFWAHINLPDAILDLTDNTVLTALGAKYEEIYDPEWRDCPAPSLTEILGQAVFDDGRFAGIKYWSVRSTKKEICVCIFKARVKKPLKVGFTWVDGKKEEVWE